VRWPIRLQEWLHFVRHLGLVDSGQLSVAAAKQIFLWSRIRGVRDFTRTGKQGKRKTASAAVPAAEWSELRLRHLFPIDFCEAIVRMATMLSLPTDEDIHETGAADAGEARPRTAPRSPRSPALCCAALRCAARAPAGVRAVRRACSAPPPSPHRAWDVCTSARSTCLRCRSARPSPLPSSSRRTGRSTACPTAPTLRTTRDSPSGAASSM
jgi:hypothetical protein